MSLETLINQYRETILAFVWRQWGQLGVSTSTRHRDRWCQDPEALLAFSLEVARWEPRMFDEILDWLVENGQELIWQRLKNLMAQDPGIPDRVIEAAYGQGASNKASKKRSSSPQDQELEPLFRGEAEPLSASGTPDPVFQAFGILRPTFHRSGKSQSIRPTLPIAFAFKLRAVFGASGRSEVLRYLFLRSGRQAGTVEIADAALHSRFGIQQTLDELSKAGLVQKGAKGQKDFIWWLDDEGPLECLLPSSRERPTWIGWPSVFRGLALIWRWLMDPARATESEYIQASGAKQLMRKASPFLSGQGVPWKARDPEEHPGASYLNVFRSDIESLLAALESPESVLRTRYKAVHEFIAHHPFRTRRKFEVARGHLKVPEYAGEARRLSLDWDAFGETTAAIAQLATNAPSLPPFPDTNRQPGELFEEEDYGRYEGDTSDQSKLELERVLCTGHTVSLARGEMENVRLGFDLARIRQPNDRAPRFIRYILSNVRFPLWPRATETTDGGWSRDTLAFPFGGTSLHLTKLDTKPSLATLVLDVEFDRKWGQALPRHLSVLLSFLMGVEVRILAREGFDSEGELLYEELYSSGGSASQTRFEPIHWTDVGPDQSVLAWKLPEILSSLLERFVGLQERFNLAAIVNCIMVSNTLPVELACLQRRLSLKLIANVYSQTKSVNCRRHESTAAMFAELQIPVSDSMMRLVPNLELGEQKVLEVDSHQEHFRERLKEMGTLITLSNACFLRLLGYAGEVINYGEVGYPRLLVGTAPQGLAGGVQDGQ